MIDPIHSHPPQKFEPYSCSHSPLYFKSSSTLLSIGEMGVFNFFSQVRNLFYSLLLCLFPCFAGKAPLIEGENLPEISPTTLPSSDPFRQSFFVFSDRENWVFSNQGAYQNLSGIFAILGKGGPLVWGTHLREIRRLEKEVEKTPTHPLETLFFQLLNQEKTSQISSFRKHAIGSHFGNPWGKFLDGHEHNFLQHEEDISQYLPGFVHLLALDLDKLKKYASDKDWRGLITYVVEERIAHFAI